MSDPAKDDFKWFGEGFDRFPKRLPEDTIEYVIYILDAKLNDAQTRSKLAEIQKAAISLDRKLLKDYIWQRDPFECSLQRENNRWVLRGRTNHGDSVADEWVIVWLLRELSKAYDKAWIRMYDSDGEFLLIEAANALPRWLNPEIADNRVWLNAGKLVVIPPSPSAPKDSKDPEDKKKTSMPAASLDLADALSILSSQSAQTSYSPYMEEEAFYRTRNFPSALLAENMHHALVTVPRTLAYILRRNPRYISPAIEAFYLRDPISLKPLKSADPASLRFPPVDFVTVSVRFSKVMFAQLRSQEFPPPPTWVIPLARMRGDAADFQKAEDGMKIAAAFEMMLSDPGSKDKVVVREINVLLDDVRSGEEALPTDAEIASWNKTQDDEKWLDINFEDFERELAGKGRPSAASESKPAASSTLRAVQQGPSEPEGFGDRAAQENLQKIVSRFETFLNSDDAENAEFLDDMDHDDDASDEESDGGSEDKDGSFDDEEFERAMKEMMGLPPEQRADAAPDILRRAVREIEEYDESDEEAAEEAEAIKKMAEEIEMELNGMGALDLGKQPSDLGTGHAKAANGRGKAS